ncbi:dihydrofolate reductase family protein [Williamsia herbipolensis]|uniref:dihydrofolate reductase family protein n=1 Tax=Williamsia herbipolensis TaxID=1603258 RepID=UPI0005F801B2|nr:dihydrofolate reductase family protein [Williamsia herbipolensis]
MRPLLYSINVTLDGCCDHRGITPDAELHRRAADRLSQADALLFGRVTYEMMESAFRGADDDADPFAAVIDPAKKYVVSSTLSGVDWNAELIRGDLAEAVTALKAEPGDGICLGGVMLPMALAELDLIDEYEFVVHPRVAGHGPRLFDGLRAPLDLEWVGRQEYESGAVAMRYVPRRTPASQDRDSAA